MGNCVPTKLSLVMGNCIPRLLTDKDTAPLPIDVTFNFRFPTPSNWSSGHGFAEGRISLGELEVCQISTFTKVWSALEGGEDNLGATFSNLHT